MYKILVVDDEILIRDVIKEYGKLYDYEVDEASDGSIAFDLVKQNDYDCIILDIMMPNIDGYTTCRKIKEMKDIPVIMLSARTEEEDKLLGFQLGIDDYVSKPFSPKELMARIKVIIERNRKIKPAEIKEIVYKGIRIDISGHEVYIDEENIHLTKKEYEILVLLMNNSNVVINRESLFEKIWGDDSYSSDRTVDAHIKMLRKNLKQYGNNIVTIRGIGYKFEKD